MAEGATGVCAEVLASLSDYAMMQCLTARWIISINHKEELP